MTTFLVFVAVLAAGVVALAAVGLPHMRKASESSGLAEPDPRLPPVLLPEHVQPSDIAKLRFSVGLRGYRMDQVDAVLARLESALAQRDADLAALRRPPDDAPPGAGTSL